MKKVLKFYQLARWSLFLTLIISCPVIAQTVEQKSLIIHAARVFDGTMMRTDTSVWVEGGLITKIAKREADQIPGATVIDLGNATLLPGFIELHAHLDYQHIPEDVVLKHGITTLRDVGGPVHLPYGGDGRLRKLTSGLIITAANGYPISVMGADNIAVAVTTEQQARATVRELINGGAVIIKIALEPGGEIGAPWLAGHHHEKPEHVDHRHQHMPQAKKAWPLLSLSIVSAIVDEAHLQGKKVTAHVAETKGVSIAIKAGVDEWAHTPCNAIPKALLKRAIAQQVKMVSTLDTLSKCTGLAQNVSAWTALGGELLYGAEIGHSDIPWGIDAQELMAMKHQANMSVLDVLRSATSKAGEYLNIPLLGTLQTGAPADMIAVQGDPFESLKILEYPSFVMSGGKIILLAAER